MPGRNGLDILPYAGLRKEADVQRVSGHVKGDWIKWKQESKCTSTFWGDGALRMPMAILTIMR